MWRKKGAKEPRNSTLLGHSAHAKPPTQKCGNLDTSSLNLTQPCGWGGGPGVVALVTREQSAPIVPIARLLHVELAHNQQSPWHSLPHSGERASECNEAPGTTSGASWWGPRSAMEAMNQSGQPRNSGKRGPMWPAPLTSGGLALEEVTCRGWGPHLQYSLLIKLASLSGNLLLMETRPYNP